MMLRSGLRALLRGNGVGLRGMCLSPPSYNENQKPVTPQLTSILDHEPVNYSSKKYVKNVVPYEQQMKNLEPVANAYSLLQSLAKEDPQNFKDKLIQAIQRNKEAEKELVKMVENLEGRFVSSLETGAIMSALKTLNSLIGSVEAGQTFIVQNLENSLTWKARTCSIRELSLLLSFSVKYRPDHISATQSTSVGLTNSKTSLYKEVIKSIERRWVEITDGRTFVGVLHYPDCFSEQFIVKLEDRMTELAETLPTSDLVLILKDLGSKKRRSVPLLRSLSYHLARGKDELDLKTIADCLFALKELSFKDVDFLEALSQSALKNMDQPSDKMRTLLRSILISLGQIRYRQPELIDKICQNLLQFKDQLENRDLLAFLVTTATINYVPKNSDDLYNLIIERLTQESLSVEKSKSELLWLDVVWSLSVLNKVQVSHLKSVLSSDFYNRLLYSHDHRNVGIILKLLNVNAVAQLLFQNTYSGPTILVGDDPLLRDVKQATKLDKSKLVSSILESFAPLASPPTFLVTEVNTLMGFQIDGEAIFDANLKPLHLSEFDCFASQAFDLMSPLSKQRFQPLPPDATKVAIIVIGYHECLVGTDEPSGLTSLYLRLLAAKSYKTLFIRYDDLKPHHKKIERVKILEQKLKDLLAK